MRCKLGDISEITKLAGYEFTKYIKYIPDGEIIAVRALNLKNGALVLDDIQRISKEVSETLPRSQLHKNDIVLSYTGTLGECAQIREDGKYHLAPNVCKITPNDSVVNPNFLFQYIRCEKFKQTLINYAHGSTQPTIPMSTIRDIPVDIPDDLEKQGKIAAILSALDEKIAINRAINENLERQLDAFFENIFHDINGEVALGNVVKTISGGTPSRKHVDYYENGTICWVKSKELSGGYIFDTEEHINDLALAKSSAKIIPPHAILVAMYGATVGSYGIITKAMACNQAICALIDSENYPYTYLYQILRTQQRTLTNMAIGSAQQNISQILIKQLPLHNDTDTIAKFHTFAQPLQKRIELLEYENKQIMSIRDTLLPKLMSGEIDVSTV